MKENIIDNIKRNINFSVSPYNIQVCYKGGDIIIKMLNTSELPMTGMKEILFYFDEISKKTKDNIYIYPGCIKKINNGFEYNIGIGLNTDGEIKDLFLFEAEKELNKYGYTLHF